MDILESWTSTTTKECEN